MSSNKNLIKNSFFILIGLYFLILFIVYSTFKNYAIEENSAKLQDLLMHDKALHSYVEHTIKPVIYKLKQNGFIPQDYFDPKVLSLSYISRNVMSEYNKLRIKNNLEEIKHKFASDNPRNPLNLANDKESEILKKLNDGTIKENFYKFTKDKKEYIFYAMPVAQNAASCMHCHGDPKDAPKNLIKLYGDKTAFHENVGDIRALVSITMPLTEEIKKMNSIFMFFAFVLFIIFIIIYIIIYYFAKELYKRDIKLIDKANKDALTKIYNRHVFNKDIEDIINPDNAILKYLMLVDIDFFKRVNDTYGHSVGDSVLIELSDIILKITRDTDKFYRIGGEEFAILSIQKSIEDEVNFANRLRSAVESETFSEVGSITISIGITQQKKDDTFKTLFERADLALYSAKDSGRNCVKVL